MICIVSGADDRRVKRYQEAIYRVLALARELRVDGWFTCNHTHYARVAHFRQRVWRDGRWVMKRETMLQRGDLLPHFTVTTLHGDEFSYATIWQRRNLVLVALPVTDSESARSYVLN